MGLQSPYSSLFKVRACVHACIHGLVRCLAAALAEGAVAGMPHPLGPAPLTAPLPRPLSFRSAGLTLNIVRCHITLSGASAVSCA